MRSSLTVQSAEKTKVVEGDLPMSVEQGLETFAQRIRGGLLRPDDAGFDAARTIWNAMIDRSPALIVRCSSPVDVINAVNYGRDHNLQIAVHGGGHSAAGSSVCAGGLMIDLSP